MRINIPHSLLSTLILALLAVGSLAWWIVQGREHHYPDAPAGEFACLSYTPRSDSSKGAAADVHAQIDSDLQQLAKRTHCVRTYSVMNGLDYVPTAARKLGMRVLLGIWIGSNKDANEQEITRAIATANAQRDVIDAIIVGNEVLLRREQSVDALYGMLVRVRAATQLPVTYADVWDFWLKNPKLAEVSDFISIHILPYWDDQPIGIDGAMQHVTNLYAQVQQKFPGRRIYVGETGWPSAGRQREGAEPSLLNQSRFTREFIALANQQRIPYNFIEAYDQPWKKRLEGTVGGYWGLYDAQGREKFPLTGAVIADATWWRGPLIGVITAFAMLLATRVVTRQRNKHAQLQAILASLSLGCIGVMQWDYLWQSNQNWQEWLAMCSWALLGHTIFLLSLFDQEARRPRLWITLQLALLLSLAYINLGLIFDARYRDFPSVFVLLPAALLLVKGLSPLPASNSGEALLLCVWLVISAVVIAIVEGIDNGSALLWCGLCSLLGLRLMLGHLYVTTAHAEQRTKH